MIHLHRSYTKTYASHKKPHKYFSLIPEANQTKFIRVSHTLGFSVIFSYEARVDMW